jgi:hypothetical protein
MRNIDEIVIFCQESFQPNLAKTLILGAGSLVSNITSKETTGLISDLSGVTGWGLALATIFALGKTVLGLFAFIKTLLGKLEDKEKQILDLQEKRIQEAKEE